MTVEELRRIALRLSNWGWCRHWLNWPVPRGEPGKMAVQVMRGTFDPLTGFTRFEGQRLIDLEDRGFELAPGQDYVYVIERTNEDGTPFRSEL